MMKHARPTVPPGQAAHLEGWSAPSSHTRLVLPALRSGLIFLMGESNSSPDSPTILFPVLLRDLPQTPHPIPEVLRDPRI